MLHRKANSEDQKTDNDEIHEELGVTWKFVRELGCIFRCLPWVRQLFGDAGGLHCRPAPIVKRAKIDNFARCARIPALFSLPAFRALGTLEDARS